MINQFINIFTKTVYAEDFVGTIAPPSGIPSDIGNTGNFISGLVRFFIIIAGLFTLVQFLIGGFTYITSSGDKAKVTEATNKITNSIIGLVVIAASFVIIAIISKLLFGSFTTILIPSFTQVAP